MGRKKARLDENHHKVVLAFEQVGFTVKSLASIGNGIPDLLIGYGDANFLVEVKTEKGKLTQDQLRFFEEWDGQVDIIRSTDEIDMLIDNFIVALTKARKNLMLLREKREKTIESEKLPINS